MRRFIAPLFAATCMFAAALPVSAQELIEMELEAPAKAENMFTYYQITAPEADYQKFLEDNSHLGILKPTQELPAGTKWYVVPMSKQ